jgi:hypothetical protein
VKDTTAKVREHDPAVEDASIVYKIGLPESPPVAATVYDGPPTVGLVGGIEENEIV